MCNQEKEGTEMKREVILIGEENHGIVGVATDISSALRFLIEEDWVDDLYDDKKEKYVYHTELFERYNVDNLYDLMMAMYNENKYAFDGMFYFHKTKLFE